MEGWQQAMWAGVVVMAVLFVYVLARVPQPAASRVDTVAARHPVTVGE